MLFFIALRYFFVVSFFKFWYNELRETNKGDKMLTKKDQIELEYLKAKADHLDRMVDIYNDQFGPTDSHVVFLKSEIRKINDLILDLLVKDQKIRLEKATIE